MQLARIMIAIAPLLAVITTVFGAVQIYVGIVAARAGSLALGLFYGAFGIGGIALGMALLRLRKQVRDTPK